MKQYLLLIIFSFFTHLAVTAQVGIGGGEATAWEQSRVDQKPAVKVFPNPATDHIQLSHAEGIDQLIIFNVVGRKMLVYKAVENKKYEIADLPSGMYLVQLIGNNGKVITTQRMNKR